MMSFRFLRLLLVCGLAMALRCAVHAQLYLDFNGKNTAGSGITAGQTITWSTANPNTFWNGDSTGGNAAGNPSAWTNGSLAVFSAGTDAAGLSYTLSLASTITVGGITVEEGNVTVSSAGGGTIAMAANSSMNIASGTSLTMSAALGGAFNLSKTGSGSLTLSGANTYTGTTSILAGTLNVGAAAPSGSAGALGNATSAVLLGDTTGSSNASLLITGAFTVARDITAQSGNSGTITFGGSNTSGTATLSGTLTANKNLTISQASGGTLNLTGAISASGATLATSGGGTLTLSGGSAVNISTLSIGSGITNFQRSGSATVGSISFSGGQINLGTTGITGTQFGTSTAVTFNGGGTLALGVSSTQSFGTLSILSSGGTIDFTSGSTGTISFTGAGTFTGGQTLAVSGYNYNSGSGTRLQVPGLDSTQLSQILFSGIGAAYAVGGGNYLVPSNDPSAIPEPSTYAALAGLGALSLAIYRRRRTQSTAVESVAAM